MVRMEGRGTIEGGVGRWEDLKMEGEEGRGEGRVKKRGKYRDGIEGGMEGVGMVGDGGRRKMLE